MADQVLLILGAGPHQLPAIRKAGSLGVRVATADYLPENVGHHYADVSFDVSTTDKGGILALARELSVTGIATFASDVATPTVAHVAAEMGLAGCPVSAIESMVFKDRFRTFQHEKGLRAPAFREVGDFEQAWSQRDELRLPLMFKPVDTSGSRGVVKLNEIDRDSWSDAFHAARRFSRSGRVCMEEFLPGTEVGGDAFLVDGEICFIELTDKYKSGFVVTGHAVPAALEVDLQQRIRDELARTCELLGYRNGPLNFDVIVDDQTDSVTVLEMSPRTGGNGIPLIVERLRGVDLLTQTLNFSLGRQVDLKVRQTGVKACGSLVFGTPESGSFLSMASAEEVMKACPEIFHFEINVKPEDDVSGFTHGGAALGYCLFDLPETSDYSRVADRVRSLLNIRVKSA